MRVARKTWLWRFQWVFGATKGGNDDPRAYPNRTASAPDPSRHYSLAQLIYPAVGDESQDGSPSVITIIFPCLRDKDVARLEIAVSESDVMAVGQSLRQ